MPRRTLKLWVLLVGLSSAASTIQNCTSEDAKISGASTRASSWNGDPVVLTKDGPVRGFADEMNTWVWKAIPFAVPPVGALRWKAPQDPEPWSSTREVTEFGPACTQYFITGDPIVGEEDCLYLNLWRPQSLETELPVYVWIHGGGNSIGASTLNDYYGGRLAATSRMVVVTVNYRLGPLGWFTHPCLRSGTIGAEKDDSGNYGTLDLIKALEWVRSTIRAFGGDPDRVTIAGESAGALDVLSLLTSPLAQGLFHRAVVESGVARSYPLGAGDERAHRLILWLLVRDGRAPDETAAEEYLAGMTGAEIEGYLRSKTAKEILSGYTPEYAGMLSFPNPFEDGTVIPLGGFDTFRSGTYPNKVPLIIGSNKEEMKLFIFSDPSLSGRDDLYQIVASYGSDDWKARGVDEIARTLRAHDDQPAIYAYQFLWGAWKPPGRSVIPPPWGFKLGCCHTLEIPFFFGNDAVDVVLQAVLFTRDNYPGRRALSTAMMSYAAQFARTGDPNRPGSGLPVWSPWSNEPRGPKCILFDVDDNQDLDIAMSSEELTPEAVRERMAAEVPEPLYSEARAYLGW